MKPKRHAIEIAVISALFILLAVWGVIWDITSGLLTGGIDGIMLLFVCLMMAGIFAVLMLFELQKAGLIPAFSGAKTKAEASASSPATKSAGSAPAAKPASPASQATVESK